MQEENITRALIVVQQGMTPSAKQVGGGPAQVLSPAVSHSALSTSLPFLPQLLTGPFAHPEGTPGDWDLRRSGCPSLRGRARVAGRSVPRL